MVPVYVIRNCGRPTLTYYLPVVIDKTSTSLKFSLMLFIRLTLVATGKYFSGHALSGLFDDTCILQIH